MRGYHGGSRRSVFMSLPAVEGSARHLKCGTRRSHTDTVREFFEAVHQGLSFLANCDGKPKRSATFF